MRSGRLFLLSMLLAASPLWGAGGFEVDSRRHGEAIEVTAIAELVADPARAWAVLTDYEAYPGFIPDLAVSRVVEREGAALVLEQAGEVRLWWWRMPQTVRLAVVETPPRMVRSRLLAGTVKEMEGRYELTPTPDGVRLVYRGRVVLPAAQRGLFDLWAVRRTVASQFRALAAEIERRGAGGGVPDAAPAERARAASAAAKGG